MIELKLKNGLILFLFSCLQISCSTAYNKKMVGFWAYEYTYPENAFSVHTKSNAYEYVRFDDSLCYYKYKKEWINDSTFTGTYVSTNCSVNPIINLGESATVTILSINDSTMKYMTSFRGVSEFNRMFRIDEIMSDFDLVVPEEE